MKFDQIMEKVEINHIDSLSIYQSLIFNIDEESKIEYSNGNKYWLLNGKLHRADGPAIEYSNGDKSWYLNDKLHRADGPAVERSDGNKYWYLNGKCHRADGPAIEFSDGGKHWYLNGIQYSEKEFNEKVKK